MAKPKNRHAHTIRHIESAANSSLRTADKAAAGFARWMVTDHSGLSKAMQEMPEMGFIDSIKYFITQMVFSLLTILLTGAIASVGIAYGVGAAWLISGSFHIYFFGKVWHCRGNCSVYVIIQSV